jgi:hypothetical protein
VLVAAAPPGSITGYLLAFRHPAFHTNGPLAWVGAAFPQYRETTKSLPRPPPRPLARHRMDGSTVTTHQANAALVTGHPS